MGEARTLTNLGLIYQDQCRTGEAIEALNASLRIFDELAEQRGWAMVLHCLADVYRGEGEVTVAEGLYRKVAEVLRSQGDPHGAAEALHSLGELLLEAGRTKEGRECLAAAAELAGVEVVDAEVAEPVMVKNTTMIGHNTGVIVNSDVGPEMNRNRLGFFGQSHGVEGRELR